MPEPILRVQRHNGVMTKWSYAVGLVTFLVCVSACSRGGGSSPGASRSSVPGVILVHGVGVSGTASAATPDGKSAASSKSDAHGHFRVALKPGNYVLRGESRANGPCGPITVHVPVNGDTGGPRPPLLAVLVCAGDG
jgi:hypothetical protein